MRNVNWRFEAFFKVSIHKDIALMAGGTHWDVGKIKIDIEHYTQMR